MNFFGKFFLNPEEEKNIHPLFNVMQNAIERYERKATPTPFLEHVKYFSDENGKIDACSIADKWHKLTGVSKLMTWIKGKITIKGANIMSAKMGCPYKAVFESPAEIMSLLKHKNDTGIVNKDGSINTNLLRGMLVDCVDHNCDPKNIFLRQSRVFDYIKKRATDTSDDVWWLSFETVAYNEWKDAFATYSDMIQYDEPCMSLDTFLQFYFQPKLLNDKTLLKLK